MSIGPDNFGSYSLTATPINLRARGLEKRFLDLVFSKNECGAESFWIRGSDPWSGDVDMTFTARRKQTAEGLNVAVAGILLRGSDIGGLGFCGQCTAELYVRWFQCGAFCPLFRPHGDEKELREPWQFGPKIKRGFARSTFDCAIASYRISAMPRTEPGTAGIPTMRALVADFPNDPNVIKLSDEYLFGPDPLVAPIVDQGD